jgi:hypothetical protein
VTTLRRVARAAIVSAALMSPAAALACPACAGRDDGKGGRTAYFVGSMILIPFGIAAGAVRIIRRLDRDDAGAGANQ